MRILFGVVLLVAIAFGQSDCNQIFELRKMEIVQEIDRLERQKAELADLKRATTRVLQGKEAQLADQQAQIAAQLEQIEAERAQIEALTRRNQQILDEIGQVKDDKLVELYTNMRPSSAGEVMNAMDPYLAARILNSLSPKIAADIVARMDPPNAARLTVILQRGPPFEERDE